MSLLFLMRTPIILHQTQHNVTSNGSLFQRIPSEVLGVRISAHAFAVGHSSVSHSTVLSDLRWGYSLHLDQSLENLMYEGVVLNNKDACRKQLT